MYLQTDDGDFQPLAGNTIVDELPAGAYYVLESAQGPMFRRFSCSHERLVCIDNEPLYWLKRAVDEYLRPTTYRMKTALMLYGPPGIGKNSLLRLLFDEMIANDAVIIIDCPPRLLCERVIPLLQQRRAGRPLVIVYEQFQPAAWHGATEAMVQLVVRYRDPRDVLVIGVTEAPDKIRGMIRLHFESEIEIQGTDDLGPSYRLAVIAEKYPQLSAEQRSAIVEQTLSGSFRQLDEACLQALDLLAGRPGAAADLPAADDAPPADSDDGTSVP